VDRSLVVFGDYPHFKHSLMGALEGRCFRSTPAETWRRDSKSETAFIRWAPWSLYQIPQAARALFPAGAHVINDTHFDCAKDNVHRHMQAVFGYSSAVNSETSVNRGVIKSKTNATHDGVIIDFPCRTPGNCVAEILIDNITDDGLACDIRLPMILGEIPLAYLKYRPKNTRFSNTNSHAKLISPLDALSAEELAMCITFARSIGLDYGELDVLRDRTDGRIYIVDANNTPYGPPNHLPGPEHYEALSIFERAFAKFIPWIRAER